MIPQPRTASSAQATAIPTQTRQRMPPKNIAAPARGKKVAHVPKSGCMRIRATGIPMMAIAFRNARRSR